jgi:tetratricopeptide (TPR) repeat protein
VRFNIDGGFVEMARHSADEEQEKFSISLSELIDLKKEQIAEVMAIGYTLYEQGRLKEAARIFEGLLVLDPDNAYVNVFLGSIYQQQGQLEIALKRYDRALALFPYDTNALTNRGEIFLKLGRFQEAAQDFKLAIELDPRRKDPAANRALLLVNSVRDALTQAEQDTKPE